MTYSYKTALSFGLVYVPITLHTCVKENDLSFNTLYKKTGERIKYHKTCDGCPKNLKKDDIIKGFQYEKDKYITLTDAELEKLKTPKDKVIEIESFVSLDEIDPVYFDKSYFVNPTSAENAFSLIVKALDSQQKVGIAKTVLGTKEQVVAIRVINDNMILTTMHFFDEIVASPVKKIVENTSEKELSLAKIIIENMTENFQPDKYKNEYREKVLKAVSDKVSGKNVKGERAKTLPSNVLSLMDALQKSVASSPTKLAQSSNKSVDSKSGKKPSKKSTKKSNVLPFKKNAS